MTKIIPNFGIGGKLLKWFSDYFARRSQFFKYKNCISWRITNASVIPQSSHLDTLLINIYINNTLSRFSLWVIWNCIPLGAVMMWQDCRVIWIMCLSSVLKMNYLRMSGNKVITFSKSKNSTPNQYVLDKSCPENVNYKSDFRVALDIKVKYEVCSKNTRTIWIACLSWSQESPLGVARFVQISWLKRRFPVAISSFVDKLRDFK